jgi:hypothetical protein
VRERVSAGNNHVWGPGGWNHLLLQVPLILGVPVALSVTRLLMR